MNELTTRLFSTEYGRELYDNFLKAISDFDLDKHLCGGMIIGLSGGADSVALLLLLLKYREEHTFPLKAIHVNHKIRGAEAKRDQDFTKKLCSRLGVDFEFFEIDVPTLAREKGIGIEEAARNARYQKFDELTACGSLYSTVAVAHNATDNLETVIFNMMRGAGLAGMCGIRPVRGNIIRPLIYSSKELIRRALFSAQIEFVVDSTNLSSDYTRNYIRNEIVPKLSKLSENPERMCTRMTSNLREDEEFLSSYAKEFIEKNQKSDGKIPTQALASLKKPVFFRVISLLSRQASLPSPEKVHLDSAFSLIHEENFSLSFPGGVNLVSFDGNLYFSGIDEEAFDFEFEIKEGINKFDGFDSVIVLSKDKDFDYSSIIYKKSIQVKLKFDIINNRLFVRSKKDGDAYRFGNLNRKLKKLFNDRKIAISDRKRIPVFCDDKGIIWLPGFPARDDLAMGDTWYLTILNPDLSKNGNNCFYIGNN